MQNVGIIPPTTIMKYGTGIVIRNAANNIHFDQHFRFFDSEFKLPTLSYNFVQTLTLNQIQVNKMSLVYLFDDALIIADKIDSDCGYQPDLYRTLPPFKNTL
jgi:hypothetical protein